MSKLSSPEGFCPLKGLGLKGLPRAKSKGFTLIELLIVIAIIAILAVVIVIAINPAQILQKSKDSQRYSDLTSLATAVNLYLADDNNLDSAAACTGLAPCVTNGVGADNPKMLNDGTGWVPIDFTGVSSGAPIAALPLDPENDATNFYRFAVIDSPTNTYEIDAVFEHPDNTGKHGSDGGNSLTRYEIGTDLTILP